MTSDDNRARDSGVRRFDARELLRREWATALFTCALILFRGRSFFSPVSDPTVGLYLHIARTWLHGSLPYVTAWDYRPPGFFALYAAAIALVGGRFANVTLGLASLLVSTLAVGRIAVLADPYGSRATGRLASAFFVLLSPVDDGVAGVAELPMTAFVAWSIAVTLRKNASLRTTAIGGLLAGCAVQCKLSALPLALVPAILAGSGGALASVVLFVTCATLPTLATVVLYASAGRLRLLDDAIVGATLRRASTLASYAEFRRNYQWVPRQLLELCPQIELAVLALSSSTNRARFATIGWFVAGAASIVLAGEFFERQFFVLVAPASVLGALGSRSLLRRFASRVRVRDALAAVLAATFILHDYFETNQTLQYAVHRVLLRDTTWRLDQADELVVALESRPACSLYLIEQSAYVYDELGISPPTRYPYSDHLLDRRLARMAGVNGTAELDRILARSPRYVVVSGLRDFRYDRTAVEVVRRRLASSYRLTLATPRFRIYQSNSSMPCTRAAPGTVR